MAKKPTTVQQALNTPPPDAPGIYAASKYPSYNEATGTFAKRTPATGPLRIEGSGDEWLCYDSNGVVLNPPITSAQSLAYWLKQNNYARRVENLDDLGSVPPTPASFRNRSNGSPGYKIADVALGKF